MGCVVGSVLICRIDLRRKLLSAALGVIGCECCFTVRGPEDKLIDCFFGSRGPKDLAIMNSAGVPSQHNEVATAVDHAFHSFGLSLVFRISC